MKVKHLLGAATSVSGTREISHCSSLSSQHGYSLAPQKSLGRDNVVHAQPPPIEEVEDEDGQGRTKIKVTVKAKPRRKRPNKKKQGGAPEVDQQDGE